MAFPDFEVESVEKSLRPTRSGLVEVYFEYSGATADGIALDVEIDSAGTQYLVEVEATDVSLRVAHLPPLDAPRASRRRETLCSP